LIYFLSSLALGAGAVCFYLGASLISRLPEGFLAEKLIKLEPTHGDLTIPSSKHMDVN
jgi:hypothetical protein